MKALTISQPFASLIMSGEKFVENRTWETKHRGILLIHAGRGTQYLTKSELQHYPHGCILGAMDLRACVHINEIRRASRVDESLPELSAKAVKQLDHHRHTEGPFCWCLSGGLRFDTPIPWKGGQGLWEFPDELYQEAIKENGGEFVAYKGPCTV